jgi:hypothetical protein
MNPVILISSCRHDVEAGHNEAIRQTWAKNPAIPVFFILGAAAAPQEQGSASREKCGRAGFLKKDEIEAEARASAAAAPQEQGSASHEKRRRAGFIKKDDEIVFPVKDDYLSLPHKTQQGHRWARAQGYDYIFQCFTDTYVDTERLLNSGFERGGDYIGNKGAHGCRGVDFCHGGPGYWLSPRASDLIAASSIGGETLEDQWVAQVMKNAGISIAADPRYSMGMTYEFCEAKPLPGNDRISCHLSDSGHKYKAGMMFSAERLRFGGARPGNSPETFLWSILILTMPMRAGLLDDLLDGLEPQLRGRAEIELILRQSDPRIPVGDQREAMRRAARGQYISFIDDDDLVSPRFVERILHAMQAGPDYIGFNLEQRMNGEFACVEKHSLGYGRVGMETPQSRFRDLSHFNPMRTRLALQAPMTGWPAEDVRWADALRKLQVVQTEKYLDETLYYLLTRTIRPEMQGKFAGRGHTTLETLKGPKMKVKMLTSIAGNANPRYDLPEHSFAPQQVVDLHPQLAAAWIHSGIAEEVEQQLPVASGQPPVKAKATAAAPPVKPPVVLMPETAAEETQLPKAEAAKAEAEKPEPKAEDSPAKSSAKPAQKPGKSAGN